MLNLRHILFPYDFSVQGQLVAPFVRALARTFDARITILSVVPPTFEAVPASAGSQLDPGGAGDLADLQGERVSDRGDPAIRIVDFADKHDVDLIMMPTHGPGRFRSLLVGSVTAEVLHDARCPVWTAAHAETQSAPRLPRNILCAVDGTPAASSLIQWAAEFSTRLEATLHLLHVVGPVSDWPSLESERRLQEHLREQARGHVISAMKSAGVDVPCRVAVGEIVRAVTEDAQQAQADLVIIGRGSVPAPFGRLRTHAFGIIRGAPCPVISV